MANKKASPAKFLNALFGGAARRREQRAANEDLGDQMDAWEDSKMKNPYAGVTNPYANLENVYEDQTVNVKQAEFEKEQSQQAMANVMAGMQGAAGGSGVAGLAQSLADAGAIQAGKVSADIAKQEAENQALRAIGTLMYEQLMGQGKAAVQAAESGRISTVLGMEYGALTGALTAQQQAQQNILYGQQTGAQMQQQGQLAMAGLIADMDFSSLATTQKPEGDVVVGNENPDD